MNKKDIINRVNDVLEQKKQSEIAYNDLIKELFLERDKAKKLLDSAHNLVEKRKDDFNNINNVICDLQGHKFDWREKESPFWDNSVYYEGKCEICGFVKVENKKSCNGLILKK